MLSKAGLSKVGGSTPDSHKSTRSRQPRRKRRKKTGSENPGETPGDDKSLKKIGERTANVLKTHGEISEVALRTGGQRRVNLIWETTQAIIAVLVTGSIIYISLLGQESDTLSNAFTLVMALYFVRMNHVKIGGVGGSDANTR